MAWKLWENGINHIDRYDESNGITDRFNGAVWTRKFSRKDTMHWNGTKQMFASCENFSWFIWEAELATLGLIAINDIKDGIKIKRNGNYGIDGFNKINWSDGTNGTEELIELLDLFDSIEWKCQNGWNVSKLIGLTICMVGGTGSGARIYNAKIRRNRAAFPNSIKSRKVKGKNDKNLFSVQKHWYAFYRHWADGGGVGGRHSLQRRSIVARYSLYFR